MTTETQQQDGGAVAAADETLTVTDNRTGKQYEIPIQDNTIRATELRKSVRPWAEARQAAEIDELLNGSSIILRGSTVPLAVSAFVVP